MTQPNLNLDPPPGMPVRRTELKPWLTEETMSPLGRELMKIAHEIEQADEPALDEDDIERELSKRRGGYAEDGE